MRAVIYCRVSTKEQVAGLSLQTQEKACRQYAERMGFEVSDVFVDEGESAKTADRPQFKRMLEHCARNKGKIHFLIVYNLSRFSRNQFDYVVISSLLKKQGVTLRSATEPITDDATGTMMQGICALFAQYENQVKAERTIAGMREALSAGTWPWPLPLGYRKSFDGTGGTVPDPEVAPLIERAFNLYATGTDSKRRVLEVVTALGLRSRSGGKVTPQTFDAILRNPFYAGWLVVPSWNHRTRGRHSPIVREEVFQQVQSVLSGKALSPAPHRRQHPDFPLRVFVKCGICGQPLTGAWSTGRNQKYPYYRGRGTCRHVNIRKEELEKLFVEKLEKLKPLPEYRCLFKEIVRDRWKDTNRELESAYRLATQQLDTLRKKREQLEEAFIFKRAITQETYDRQTARLDEEIALAEMAQMDARLEQLDIEGLLAFADHLMANAARLWLEATPEHRERLQQVFFPQGLTFAGGEFGTAVTSLLFSALPDVQTEKTGVASPTGFEPVLPP